MYVQMFAHIAMNIHTMLYHCIYHSSGSGIVPCGTPHAKYLVFAPFIHLYCLILDQGPDLYTDVYKDN